MLTTPFGSVHRVDPVGALALDQLGEALFAALGGRLRFGPGEFDLFLGDLGVRGERGELAVDLRLDLRDASMQFVDPHDFGGR